MKEGKYPLEPFKINDLQWYYITPRGICVVAEKRDAKGVYLGTTQVNLTWNKINKAYKYFCK